MEKQHVVFRVTPDRDAYVGVWMVAPDGSFAQLFPNEYESDHAVKKGQTRTIPDPKLDYDITAYASGGAEQVRVVASTRKWSPFQGEKDGPYQVFKSLTDRQRLAEGVKRILVVEPKEKVAEEAVTYRVTPGK